MKFMKIAVAAVFAFAFGNAYAFHSGGVAECEGCHSMHNSFEGSSNVTGGVTGPYLLKAQDQSGACLNCHGAGTTLSGYHVSTEGIVPYVNTSIPQQLTPGGDFSWLKKTMTVTVRGKSFEYDADRNGHNIVAQDFGYTADKTLVVAPGGTYPRESLACSSCHDPHGRTRRLSDGSYVTPAGPGTSSLPIRNSGSYNSSVAPNAAYAVGAYRILAGVGYQPKSTPGYPFASQPPDASAPSSYNRAETSQQTQTFVAYGKGMSEWCANCHTAFLQSGYVSGDMGLRHPAGELSKLPQAIVNNYNAYVTSGVMSNVTLNNAYSSLTPFEVGSNDYESATGLKARSNQTGAFDRSAQTTNNVACVSCHRVHASGFESMLRFFYLNEFSTIGDDAGVAAYDPSITENKINYGYDAVVSQQAYNGRPASMLGPYARKACNKCHAKD